MQTVSVRNGVKRRKTSAKRRNPVKRVAANPRKKVVRRKRRNPATSYALAPVSRRRAVSNPKRKSVKRRKRRNGASVRNGIFTGIVPVLKSVALGGGGAVATGIMSNGVMSLARGITNNLPLPEYAVKSAVEVALSLTVVKYAAEKIFDRQNSDKVVAGGLIKAGLTAISGIAPDVVNFNPLANSQRILSNSWGALDNEPIMPTSDLAGVYEDAGMY